MGEMNKDTYDKINEYHRNRIIIKTKSGLTFDDDDGILAQWGAGEYKLNCLNVFQEYNKNLFNDCTIYIPYASFKTIEKALVLTEFFKVNNIKIEQTLIGYVSYSRQDRSTETEPRLDNYLLGLIAMLSNPVVIDIHNADSLCLLNIKQATYAKRFYNLAKTINPDCLIVAPDAGAKKRLESYGVKVDMCFDKERTARGVKSKLSPEDGEKLREMFKEDKENNFATEREIFIIDDICDGGRTFNVARDILTDYYPYLKCNLMITHAILPYPYGFDNIRHFNKVYAINTAQTTNMMHQNLVVIDELVPKVDIIE